MHIICYYWVLMKKMLTAGCSKLHDEELRKSYSITVNTSNTRWAVKNLGDKKCKVSTSRFLATDSNTRTITVSEPGYRSRYSDWLRDGRPRGRSSSPGGSKNFYFSMSSRLALGPTQPPIQWVPGALSPGGGGKEAGV
jgi:hypothetical protein